MVFRVYVEKRPELANEANGLKKDINELLGISGVTGLRLLNRYDVENIEKTLFDYAVKMVFSEPQLDITYASFEDIKAGAAKVFAVEYLPGQFDQRADSAAQCIQIISQGERPTVRTAKIFLIEGDVTEAELEQIRKYVINPVESREAGLAEVETLRMDVNVPTEVEELKGFRELSEAERHEFVKNRGLAMDYDDLTFCQEYFKKENRDPSITEIKMIDTYWSDHCRHTTFLTEIDSVEFDDPLARASYEEYIKVRQELGRTKPVCLMDIGTIAAKYLRTKGLLGRLDESEEINACTVKIDVNVEGKTEKWLLLFKNETHNHPTEIEPFGGAATCLGGAIRDPLSGRSYVYSAMRVTGAGDPLKPVSETIPGKLPQRKLVTTAAAGYSSYGNQIGLATGQVDEIYHPGYVAKRMEIGAVIAAAPEENVRRERPIPGDIVILLGGRTGRDGCGGATGSSKAHTLESLESCGAEVQKGNAPEERKLQRLFRNPKASKMIKRCNDFGAGGVSVAIGELADGLLIDLNKVPKKYEGLDGTELAISESQERMAVVVAAEDADAFRKLADSENLESTVVAQVTEEARLVMTWNGKKIVDISREFLDSNGASKHIDVKVDKSSDDWSTRVIDADSSSLSGCEVTTKEESLEKKDFVKLMKAVAGDLNCCSKRGLSERFDSTIGSGTVLMPFGGRNQQTPTQAMVNKISIEKKTTDTVSFMSWGYNPFISEKSPYRGAYLAVLESVCKLIATGADFKDVYLTFQEYFEKPGHESLRWGKPMSAILGALKAQLDYKIAAIGGKDSMSGSFEKLDVPPTLVSFAVTTGSLGQVISPEFKGAGHKVLLVTPEADENGLPVADSVKKEFELVASLRNQGLISAAYTPTLGGIAEAIIKMAIGNDIGFKFAEGVSKADIFGYSYGSFILEIGGESGADGFSEIESLTGDGFNVRVLGETTGDASITFGQGSIAVCELLMVYEGKLEPVYPTRAKMPEGQPAKFDYDVNKNGGTSAYHSTGSSVAQPLVIIPAFPGTNCEYDTAKSIEKAGATTEIIVINNLTAKGIADSVEYFAKRLNEAQMFFIPGGFSGGDEPDGSAKFITAFFRNGAVKEAVTKLLEERDGLAAGICNGFQALVKLGLVPFGKIIDTDENCPTLTFNTIGRHQSRLVRTRIASNKSPWLMNVKVGDVITVPISHGEGRFLASDKVIADLAANGQIATQYVDLAKEPTYDISFNPNGSACAIEGILSPDGRVIGKMGHSERIDDGIYRNVPGKFDMGMFDSAVKYFR